jgi:DNA mismatch endonuclease (patch repair protein)
VTGLVPIRHRKTGAAKTGSLQAETAPHKGRPTPFEVSGTDIFDPVKRSDVMSRVRSSNTKPERIIRSLLHRMGYRFRLHRRDLPGSPDIVLPKRRAIIFVHGCYWHQHAGCKKGTIPKQNSEFWSEKLTGNVRRDLETRKMLRSLGWRVLVIWECETKGKVEKLSRGLSSFLAGPPQLE